MKLTVPNQVKGLNLKWIPMFVTIWLYRWVLWPGRRSAVTQKGDVIVGMGLHSFSETRATKALPVLDQF